MTTTTPALPAPHFSRRALVKGGAMTIAFSLFGLPERATAQAPAAGAARASLDAKKVDTFFAMHADGSVTLYSGKVDLGQGLRIAMRQIAAEELGLAVDRIDYVEGDTALTPNQGRTSGSYGIQQGGMQIRRAAATARKALLDLAAKQLNVAPETLDTANGEVRPKVGGTGITFAALLAGRQFELEIDPKAPLKDPASYALVGKPLPRPDVAAKCTGTQTYIQDLKVDGMLHARVIRPPSVGATLVAVDEASIAGIPGARVLRVKDLLAVATDEEWSAVKAARTLKAQWSETAPLPEQAKLIEALRGDPTLSRESILAKGTKTEALPAGARTLKATYFWPMHSHGSIGPSCAVADVNAERAIIWTASQGTHGNQTTFARFLGLPKDKVRMIYVEGSGCYGMNGHEDAAADAAILSRAAGRPVRVQWSREDELGWDPKGPPQLIDVTATIAADGSILDWLTEMWLPRTTKGLPDIPLLAPEAAGLEKLVGLNAGLMSQNGDPPYPVGNLEVAVHWAKDAILRPAPIRSPGKPANAFAVESFVDEICAAAGVDPVAYRLKGLSDPRAVEVIKRVAAAMNWQTRASPGPDAKAASARGRGFSYVRYKNSETYVAMGIEVLVDRATGRIKVEKVTCAHDCGQVINPDGVKAQIEGSIIQTLSRVLLEEVKFDRARVTSTDWSSYPLITFSDVPAVHIELIDRPTVAPTGAGEAACTTVAPALSNAVFDAIGVRLRTMPFTPDRVRQAISGANT